ncbi:hypothetical protein AVEN_10344-1 [Araneus ventricosus]|uniref:Uncharacterized protein n=1 Tax=Araneus ventricosus TaxID=182803 RepID=A0A4Y2UPB6_ARAVE|nr:hypothetical protein AVEN_10344-1 [Araneus ventricosus]
MKRTSEYSSGMDTRSSQCLCSYAKEEGGVTSGYFTSEWIQKRLMSMQYAKRRITSILHQEWIQKQSMSMQLYQRGGGYIRIILHQNGYRSSQCLCSYTKEEEVTSELFTSEWIQKQSMPMQLYQRGGGYIRIILHQNEYRSRQCLCSYAKEEVTSEWIQKQAMPMQLCQRGGGDRFLFENKPISHRQMRN